jgi:hypothetical protein
VMSRIVAERLVAHLLRSGFVLMRKPPAEMATTAGLPMGRDDGDASASGSSGSSGRRRLPGLGAWTIWVGISGGGLVGRLRLGLWR